MSGVGAEDPAENTQLSIGLSISGLLKQALRCGITVADFWQMTPRETLMVIDALIERDERRQSQDIRLAWLTAALVRSKKMPPLERLLTAKPARKLRGKELERRKREFEELKANVDVDKLAARLKE